MNSVVIIDCIRTPMGRSQNGVFRHVRAEDLSAHLMSEILKRNPNVTEDIDDIFWGCVQQTKEQGFNIARNAALLAGIHHSVPAVTVNRLCGSSMQALHDASRAIMVGDAEACIVGGVEHMGHVPMNHGVDFHPNLSRYVSNAATNMGLTAEKLAREFGINREQQDAFALRSHQKARYASENGLFDSQIIPTLGHDKNGALVSVVQDEVIRFDANLESLGQLNPVFDPINGSVTAGNASALSDGASALLVISENKAKQLNLKPIAKVLSTAVVGYEPSLMGYGPVPASLKALKKAGLDVKSIDLIELNEAFAVQALACIHGLGLEEVCDEKININGGAIALGHPLGCSGTRISTTLLRAMQNQDATLGLASMCIGMGQGIATVFERLN